MKKKFIVFTMILAVGLSSVFVYAESPITNRFQNQNRLELNRTDQEEWFKERMELRKEYLKDAVKDGRINEEEAKRWEEHFDYMKDFHRQNGYMGCYGGRGMGMMRDFGRNARFGK